jgi:phosphoribulokinase
MIRELEQQEQKSTDLKANNESNSYKPTCVDLRSLLKQQKVPIIVGIAGDSGSGKTTYSDCLKKLIGEDLISTIEMDGYHKEDRQKRRVSGRLPLDPEANHLDLLALHLKELKQGKTVLVPIYNHNSGQFDPPRHLSPRPIIIVEGLHALYPEFLPYLDFSVYLDPDYSLKWDWKYERDVKQRGHSPEALEKEMLKREAAFRRWIDFQETNANVVVKMSPSDLTHFARLRFTGRIPIGCSKVELIMEPSETPLPSLPLPFDLGAILAMNQHSFMFVAVPGTYWGRPVMHIHLDGVFSQRAINHLEEQIVNLTGIPLEVVVSKVENEWLCAGDLAELLVIWRFLEQINHQLQQLVV